MLSAALLGWMILAAEDIGITDKPGAQLPLSLKFTDHQGRDVRLADYADGRTPLVVVMAYYNCPLLCTLVLNGLTDGLRQMDRTAGDGFRVLTVSIDPRDEVQLAQLKRANHLKAYGRAVADDGWAFLVSHDGGVRTLADALGFGYRWNEETRQYIHAAGVFVVSPDGKLVRTLRGTSFHGTDLRLALVDAGQGAFGGPADRAWAALFRWNDASSTYDLALARIGATGAVTSLLLLALLVRRVTRKARA